MSSTAPAHDTADAVAEFRRLIPGLPSVYCRRRWLDIEFFKHDMKDSKSVVSKKLTEAEQKKVLLERQHIYQACMFDPASRLPGYLYGPTSVDAAYGGRVERLIGKLGEKALYPAEEEMKQNRQKHVAAAMKGQKFLPEVRIRPEYSS